MDRENQADEKKEKLILGNESSRQLRIPTITKMKEEPQKIGP